MANWPIDDQYTSIEEVTHLPANRQQSTAGYVISAKRASIPKTEYMVTVSYISIAQKETIKDFFRDNQGLAFTLNNPEPDQTGTIQVVFNQDSLSFQRQRTFPAQYTLEFSVREV